MRWRRALAALGLVVAVPLLGVSRPLGAQDVACDAPGDVEVRSLDFVGNRTFTDAELANGIVTTPSSWTRRLVRFFGRRRCLDPIEFRRDSLRLIAHYRRAGFAGVQVGTEVARHRTGAVDITFRIREGEPVILTQMSVNGLDSVPERPDIIDALPIREGRRFDQHGVEAARDTIARRLHDNGYPLAEVLRSFDADTTKRVATLEYSVSPGPRARIGAITVDITEREGAGRQIDADAVRRALDFEPGDLYRVRRLEAAKRKLFLSDAYRHVAVSPDTQSLATPGDTTIDINVSVAENYMRSTRATAGWATLDCFRTQAEYADVGFLGELRRLDLNARVSKIGLGRPMQLDESLDWVCSSNAREDPYSTTLNYYGGVSLRQSSLFGRPLTPTITLYSERRSEWKAFLRYAPIGGIASLAQPLRPGLNAIYAYQLEYGRTEAEPAIFCGLIGACLRQEQSFLRQPKRLATASVSLVRSRANDPFNPTRGSSMSLEVRHAGRFTGSDSAARFSRAVGDAAWYFRLGRDAVLAARFRGGLVFGSRLSLQADTTAFIPQQERLYAGGANTVRGFGQNEVGPLVYIVSNFHACANPAAPDPCVPPPDGADTVYFVADTTGPRPRLVLPVGGNSMTVANLELRLRSPIFPAQVQWVLFADAGEVWTRGATRAEQGFERLRITPGLGVRIASQVGPIRVDVGYNPYDRPAGAAFFNAEGVRVAPLYCVSPGNALPVTGYPGDAESPPQQAEPQRGGCPTTYEPRPSGALFRRLTWHVSIGQAF